MLHAQPPKALDLPTGLGKTSVMAVWLVAQTLGAGHLPRRLVYIVDRRAVVDQATEEAERLREWLASSGLGGTLGLAGRRLPISTLRGQFVDNHEWLEDPSLPAIIVGTVDMIGSRLLFEGYACSRKMRPYHAALLANDTVFVLDEAHLVPPFERLLARIVAGDGLRPAHQEDDVVVPRPRLMSLSATGRERDGAFHLWEDDYTDPIVRERVTARKRLCVESVDGQAKLAHALAERAWALAQGCDRPVRLLVFANKRLDAQAAKAHLEAKVARDASGKKLAVRTELFVGGRRNRERQAAAETLRQMGFIAGSAAPDEPTFLFATSAGEVGVDLDADHMVCDLVAWERMVQRLGRVNRRGKGAAEVLVLAHETDELKTRNAPVLELLERLPTVADAPETAPGWDASPFALGQLRDGAPNEYALASTPPPLHPALTRPLLDSWSMTSLREHTGRPEVQGWLRGWVDDEPQTTVLWRRLLPPPHTPARRVRLFFEAAPPHASERLEAPTKLVASWLISRVKVLSNLDGSRDAADRIPRHQPVAYALNSAGERHQSWTREDIEKTTSVRSRRRLERELSGSFLVVDARIGGLTSDGLLDDKTKSTDVETLDGTAPDDWVPQPRDDARPVVPFRVRTRTADEAQDVVDENEVWFQSFRQPLTMTEDEEVSTWLVVEKWRHAATTEEGRAAGRPQSLTEHEAWAAESARRIGEAVGLPAALCDALVVAAALHDEGKRSTRWQSAFNAPSEGRPFAKTKGPVNVWLLDGYRHELGSLPVAQADSRFKALDPEHQDLVLHLIAAHHGFARPTIRTSGCDDAPPSALVARARDVALRFFRLQARWGPWGLAWLETLMRAADQIASRRNEEEGAR